MEGDEPLKLQLKKLAVNIPLRLTLVILLVTVALWGFSATETPVYSLFQSSIQNSAVATPTPQPTNTPVPPPAATDTPIPPAATDTPVPPAPTTAPVQPAAQPTVAPTDTAAIQGGAVPAEPEATATIAPSQTEPAVLQPIAPTEPTVAPKAPAAESVPAGRVVNQVKLVDTIVKWLAYGWMCLGGVALVLVAGFFAYIHNRGKKLNHEAE